MQLRSLAILFVTAFALVEAICPSRTPPGENEITVQVGGMSRQFYVYVPRDMPDTPSEGVVMIHGCGSSPEKFELESQMNVNAAEKKWFNVYPLGTSTGTTLGWNAGTGSCRTGGIPNDVDFMRAVVLYMVENLCIDVERIFAAGFSNGGQMTYNLSCTMTDTFAAFMGNGMAMDRNFYPEVCGVRNEDLKPFFQVCGLDDSACNRDTGWFEQFAKIMDCKDEAVVTQLTATTKCSRHSQCGFDQASGETEPLEKCEISGLGHCWAGNNCCDSQCGSQDPANMDTSAYLLDWFSKVPRRAGRLLPLPPGANASMPAWNVTAARLRDELARHGEGPLAFFQESK